MRLVLAAATSLALALPATAQSLDVPSGTYTPDPTHTSVIWKISHLGFSEYTGTVARDAIDATIEVDPDDVANSSLDVTINGTEIRTLHPIEADPRSVDFNAEVESDMFLNTAANPEITFESTGIEVTGENTAIITGDLTINETTNELTLETTLNRAGTHPVSSKPTIGITATGVIKRSEYGINALLGPIGDDVTVEIQGEFVHEG